MTLETKDMNREPDDHAAGRQPTRAAAAAFVGTTIEWYDFYIYATASALIFGKLFFMGEMPGLGQTMKLVNNLLGACAIAITGEGMTMGLKAGLDPKLMIDVLNASSGRSSATQDKWPRSVLPRTFDFGFATGLSFKDVRLCVEEAEAMGVPMVVGSAVRQMLSIANNIYGPDSDFTIMAKLVESWAGLEIPDSNTHGSQSTQGKLT